jgi:hypothetical protein
MKNVISNLKVTVNSVNENLITIKSLKLENKVYSEKIVTLLKEVLNESIEVLEANNPDFAGLNIRYILVQSVLSEIDESKLEPQTKKLINNIIFVTKKSQHLNVFELVDTMNDVSFLRKYDAFIAWDDITRGNIDTMLSGIIQLETLHKMFNNPETDFSVTPLANGETRKQIGGLIGLLRNTKFSFFAYNYDTIAKLVTKYKECLNDNNVVIPTLINSSLFTIEDVKKSVEEL